MIEHEPKKKPVTLGENTHVTIPLKNLIAIALAIGAFVGQFFILNSRLDFLEDGMKRVVERTGKNTEFRILWPRGDLGQLPEDVEQSLRLDHLEVAGRKLYDKIERLENLILILPSSDDDK